MVKNTSQRKAPYYFQENAYNDLFDYIENNPFKNPVVVLPTGSGKSFVQAMVARDIYFLDRDTRVLFLTNDQKLIQQNYAEILEEFDGEMVDIGIYCAGLGLRERGARIQFAAIQSVYKKAYTDIGFYDIILIDEAHNINHKDEGMYRLFLNDMRKINKKIIFVGWSATPYRTKAGLIISGDSPIFDDICHITGIPELMKADHPKNKGKQQYLALATMPDHRMKNEVDSSKVKITAGEYNAKDQERIFSEGDHLIEKTVKEILDYSDHISHNIIFTSGQQYAETMKGVFEGFGKKVSISHSGMSSAENEKQRKRFEDGYTRALINVNMYTTGYNCKQIGCVTLARMTCSPGLYYQMLGRGFRFIKGVKESFLTLDFGRNILRHGAVDKIDLVENRQTKKKELQLAPMKNCPVCGGFCYLSAKVCQNIIKETNAVCGYEFPQHEKHDDRPDTENSVLSKWKKPETFPVQSIRYSRHEKKGGVDSLRVDYYLSTFKKFSEWVCIEHSGFAGDKAKRWLRLRLPDFDINSIDEALEKAEEFKVPYEIIVNENEKFPQIIGYKFDPPKEKSFELEKVSGDDDIPF